MVMMVWKRWGLVFLAGALCIVVNVQGVGPLWFTGVGLVIVGQIMRWTLMRRHLRRGSLRVAVGERSRAGDRHVRQLRQLLGTPPALPARDSSPS